MLKKFQLRNGLNVIFVESHKSPVVSVQMWVRTGSADEEKNVAGISHFIEHLVFKGTKSFGVGEIASTVEANGGELNAFTSFDQTVFYVTVSKQSTDIALKIIYEMMSCPNFDPEEIDREREVVIEEIKRSLDSPGREASRALFSTIYKKHPYGLPVIGYDKIIKKVSPKKIQEYFNKRYVPSNMTLIISGDISSPEMKAKVTKLYSQMAPYKLKKVVRKKEPAQKSARVLVKKTKFQESYLQLAWRIPGAGHKSIPTLELLGFVLGQGESSRLMQKLRIQKHLVNGIGSGNYILKDGGIYAVMSTLNAKNLEEVLEGIKNEFVRLMHEVVDERELQRAITNFESEEFYSMETVDGLARKVGHYEDLLRDPNYFPKFMKEVRKVKPEDISKMAKLIFDPSKVTVNFLSPDIQGAKKLIQKWLKQLSVERKKAKLSRVKKTNKSLKPLAWSPSKKAVRNLQRFTLPSGVTVVSLQTSDSPTLAVRAAYLGGGRLEPKGLEGAIELLSSTWTAGSQKYSEEDIQHKTEGMAAGLSGFGGRNTFGVSMELLSPFQKPCADLFEEILFHPTFPESIVQREKMVLLEKIKAKQDMPAQQAIQSFLEKMFDGHPYAKDLAGTEASVQKVHSEQLKSIYGQATQAKNLVIALSGHFDQSLWLKSLERASASLSLGARLNKIFPLKEISEPIKKFQRLKKEQTHIVYGFRGLTFKDEDRYTLMLIESILAGQGGRLFIELRDKNSLAYTVAPLKMEGIDAGYFGAYIACSPEKSKKAIDMLSKEFEKMQKLDISSSELDRSKKYIIGRSDIELQRNSSIAASMLFDEIYCLGFDNIFEFSEHIRSVTPADIRRVSSRLFSQCPVIVAVGSQDPFVSK